MKALLALLLGVSALAEPDAEEAGARSCFKAFSLRPDSIDIDEDRWRRLCLKGHSPEGLADLAELAAPCLAETKDAPGPRDEQAVDGCWGLNDGEGGGGPSPAGGAPGSAVGELAALPAAGPQKDAASALAAGDIGALYGEKSVTQGLHIPLAPKGLLPAKVALSGGHLSPDKTVPPAPAIERPEPNRGAAPAEVPTCGKPRSDLGDSQRVETYARIEAAAACIPIASLREPVLHYLQVLGVRGYKGIDFLLGGENKGLNRFFESLSLEDSEFREQVRAFYGRVSEVDWDIGASERPNLSDAAGKGTYEKAPPGWAWAAALETAGGDPNTAMRLIGFCGHDDVGQSRLLTPRSPEQAVEAMEASRGAMGARIVQIEAKLRAAGEPVDVPANGESIVSGSKLLGRDAPAHLRWERQDLVKRTASLEVAGFTAKSEHVCPGSSSALYAPGSLDAKADLAPDVRDRIARVQAPEKGASALPAKHYHVLGAAAAACELVRKGAPGWFARTIQGGAAWAYRTIRLNERAEIALHERNRLEKEHGELAVRLGHEAPGFEDFALAKFNATAPGDALTGAETPKALNKARVELSYIDAVTLMEDRGYGGQKVFGKRVAFSTNRADWPWRLFTSRVPDGWSKERAEAAERRLQTFLADSEWTMAQHQAGAAFAATHCRPEAVSPDPGGGRERRRKH